MIHKTFRIAASCARTLSTGTVNPLCGTVPPHSSYVFLHSQDPPASFPVKISTVFQRELQLRTLKLGTIVNFAWTGVSPILHSVKTAATVFSVAGGRLEIPEVSMENINEVEASLKAHIQRDSVTQETRQEIHLYVCTHGARDCRCGQQGGLVARLLKGEVDRRKIGHLLKVREVGHVGGHKHAANVLVYPHGEWFGQVKADDVLGVIDSVLAQPTRPFTDLDQPILPKHWRGRMGIGKDEQVALFRHYLNQGTV